MPTASDILFGVVLPLIVSGLIFAVPRFFGITGKWPGPLAIGVAFATGFGLIEGRSHLFPPGDALAKLFYLGLLFCVIGLLDSCVRLPGWLRPILVFLATLLGSRFLLQFNFDNHVWDNSHGFLWLGGIALVATIWWACLESGASEGGVIMPMAAMFTTGIAGLAVMLSADQTTGQALGALAVAVGAAVPAIVWFKEISLTRGPAMVIAGVAVCAMAGAYFVSDVPIIDLALVSLAPPLLFVSRWLPIKKPWLRLVIRLIVVLVPLGIAMALAVRQFQHEQAEKSSDPYAMVG